MKIKTNYLFIIISFLMNSNYLFTQTNSYPYPIIFIHGLNSNADTWQETISFLGDSVKVLDVCLNHDGNNSIANIDDDVVAAGWRDNKLNTPSPTRLYAINFDNEQMIGHESHNLSNQAAIYKQGKAIKFIINLVRGLESSEKVILVGHSMGGLAIREYLQRIENDNRKWWVDTTDPIGGHKVAKVVTLGTPHGGSDAWSALGAILGVNLFSEAVRDLRTTLNNNLNIIPGIYLFGGNENANTSIYYNYDVNCNGSNNDDIIGISESYDILGYPEFLIPSAIHPLPQNVKYTWIVSNWSFSIGGDFVVEADRQWLYDLDNNPVPLTLSDTLMMDKRHDHEPEDYYTIIRGLDEPAEPSLAYEIETNRQVKGFITYQSNNEFLDIDLYKVNVTNSGFLKVSIDASNFSGVGQIAILDDILDVKTFKGTDTFPTELIYFTPPAKYYVRVRGIATSDSYEFPYTLTTSFHELNLQTPVSGDVLLVESNIDIEWQSSNIDNIKLEYSTDNGDNWITIVSNISASDVSYQWEIPNTQSTECKLRISDVLNSEVSVVNDGVFSIAMPPLTLLSPNGEEDWSANSIREISWNINNLDNVKLELSTNGGVDWSIITGSTDASTLSYNWTVSNTLSNNCKIRISDALNSNVFDISDNSFTISGQNFWSTDPSENNPICTALYWQYPRGIVSDGAGGAIIVWPDCRSGNWNDLFAQLINSKGTVQWALNGVKINSESDRLENNGSNNAIVCESDEAGGAIIAWQSRSGTITLSTFNIFIQRISQNGTLLWGSDGVQICSAFNNQQSLAVVDDGNGGVIIAWADNRTGNYKIFAQRINSNGITQWTTDGVLICTAEGNQLVPRIVSDDRGGAIITWEDHRNGGNNIYSQRINSAGDIQWTHDGVLVTNTPKYYGGAGIPSIVTAGDNDEGVIVVWEDVRDDNDRLFGQRIDKNGAIMWGLDGLFIANRNSNWSRPQICEDSFGGVIVSWLNSNTLYVQRINSDGTVLWPDEMSIKSTSFQFYDAKLINDGIGGAICIWAENVSWPMTPDFDLFAQKINQNGNIEWPAGGVNISTGSVSDFITLSNERGSAIITWADGRNESNTFTDIYAQKINSNGILGGDDLPLPVELSSFYAKVEGSEVILNWRTETEINNYGFEIERSSTIDSIWTNIGFVPGHGNSNSPKEYTFSDSDLPPVNQVQYRLKQIDNDGTYEYSKVVRVDISTITGIENDNIKYKLSLEQNYPNPFNPSTTITYSIPYNGFVKIRVYDILGKEITSLVNEEKQTGIHQIIFNGSNLSSGIYFYKIEFAEHMAVKKLLLVK